MKLLLTVLELLAQGNEWLGGVVCAVNEAVGSMWRKVRRWLDEAPSHQRTPIILVVTLIPLLLLLSFSLHWTFQALSNQDKNWEGVKFHCVPPLIEPQRCRDAFERYLGNPRKPR